MQIKESCINWDMEYNSSEEIEELGEHELHNLKSILHIAGDAVGAALSMKETSLREAMIFNFAMLVSQMRDDLQRMLDDLLYFKTLTYPLDEERLFGYTLRQALFDCLVTQEERDTVQEILDEVMPPLDFLEGEFGDEDEEDEGEDE